MSTNKFEDEPDIREARSLIDRALGGISTLHLGPLDYNVFNTADTLRAAASLIERFGREHREMPR